jgi:hypothetical protein
VAGTCDRSNEPADSIKCGDFLDELKTGSLLKKCSFTDESYGIRDLICQLLWVTVLDFNYRMIADTLGNGARF